MNQDLSINNENIRQVLTYVRTEFQKIIGESLVKIILYGSCVRGEWLADSDIDIMLLIDDSEENIEKYDVEISKITFDLSLKYNVLLSVILKNYRQFSEYQDVLPFYRNVYEEGIEIYGRKAA
ncbi:MAG: nucleotidyltransferase domain-containing protein [Armatimonadota bacterium]